MTDCICPANLAILPGLVLKLFMARDFFVLFCFAFSFLFTWKLTEIIDVDQTQAQVKSLYCQQYSTIYKNFSNPKVLLEEIHHEE